MCFLAAGLCCYQLLQQNTSTLEKKGSGNKSHKPLLHEINFFPPKTPLNHSFSISFRGGMEMRVRVQKAFVNASKTDVKLLFKF